MKPRKIPLRKCTGCNEMKNKKEMIRIVRDQEGNFSLDFQLLSFLLPYQCSI